MKIKKGMLFNDIKSKEKLVVKVLEIIDKPLFKGYKVKVIETDILNFEDNIFSFSIYFFNKRFKIHKNKIKKI